MKMIKIKSQKDKPMIDFHVLYTSAGGSITMYDLKATSKRFAEMVAKEGIEEGLKDDFGDPMISFLVIDEVEYSNLPKSFFV